MDEIEKAEIDQKIVEARQHLSILQNVLNNLFVVDNGKKKLRPGVSQKDIEMLSEAIIKIKSNFRDIQGEIESMQQTQDKLEQNWLKSRQNAISFSKKYNIELPKFYKDLYQIDE